MDIWNVRNTDWNQLRLWRMDEENFRVSEAGSYSTILDNPTYTLVDKAYAPVFKQLSGQVSVKPVVIHDLLRNTANYNYVELKVVNPIDTETIHTLDSSGRRIWAYNGTLFVSGDLKKELHSIGQGRLEFHLGFSMFG